MIEGVIDFVYDNAHKKNVYVTTDKFTILIQTRPRSISIEYADENLKAVFTADTPELVCYNLIKGIINEGCY